MLPDLRIEHFAQMRLEAFVGAFLVGAHQARIAHHIGGEDRGQTSLDPLSAQGFLPEAHHASLGRSGDTIDLTFLLGRKPINGTADSLGPPPSAGAASVRMCRTTIQIRGPTSIFECPFPTA